MRKKEVSSPQTFLAPQAFVLVSDPVSHNAANRRFLSIRCLSRFLCLRSCLLFCRCFLSSMYIVLACIRKRTSAFLQARTSYANMCRRRGSTNIFCSRTRMRMPSFLHRESSKEFNRHDNKSSFMFFVFVLGCVS